MGSWSSSLPCSSRASSSFSLTLTDPGQHELTDGQLSRGPAGPGPLEVRRRRGPRRVRRRVGREHLAGELLDHRDDVIAVDRVPDERTFAESTRWAACSMRAFGNVWRCGGVVYRARQA
jgi:hypothetical protein